MPERSRVIDSLFPALAELAQITEQLLSGGYDGMEGAEGSNDTTFTDFGIVCGIAERFGELLRRLNEWDALTSSPAPYGDGPYWKAEIERVLGV